MNDGRIDDFDEDDHWPGAALRGELRSQLDAEEASLADADEKLRFAQLQFDMAARKYAALRDMFEERFGEPAYTDRTMRWADEHDVARGYYRFIFMSPGDAVVAALKESQEPQTLQQIVVRLGTGGYNIGKGTVLDGRVVNAALMNLNKVHKTDDGKYFTDDLPF